MASFLAECGRTSLWTQVLGSCSLVRALGGKLFGQVDDSELVRCAEAQKAARLASHHDEASVGPSAHEANSSGELTKRLHWRTGRIAEVASVAAAEFRPYGHFAESGLVHDVYWRTRVHQK